MERFASRSMGWIMIYGKGSFKASFKNSLGPLWDLVVLFCRFRLHQRRKLGNRFEQSQGEAGSTS